MLFNIFIKTVEDSVYNIFTGIISKILCEIYRFVDRNFCWDLFLKIEHLRESNHERKDICFEHRIYVKLWSIEDYKSQEFILLLKYNLRHLMEIVSIWSKVKSSLKKSMIKKFFVCKDIYATVEFLEKETTCFRSWCSHKILY